MTIPYSTPNNAYLRSSLSTTAGMGKLYSGLSLDRPDSAKGTGSYPVMLRCLARARQAFISTEPEDEKNSSLIRVRYVHFYLRKP